MRICFIITDVGDGGAQVQCIRLMQALQQMPGVEALLLYLHDGVQAGMLSDCTFRHERVAVRSNYDPRTIWRIHKRLRKFQPDIIMTWLQAADLFGFALQALDRRRAWIMTERDSRHPDDWRFRLRVAAGRKARAIICNSEAGAEYWRAHDIAVPLHVISNIVAVPPPRPGAAGGCANGVILSVGRLEGQKNPLVLTEAFCLLARQRPELRFEIIGKGGLSDGLAAMIAHHGVADRVNLLGYRTDARERICNARAVVTMSRHEGTPNVLLETVAAGVPAIVSDIPEHRAVLGDDYPFLVNDLEDPGACADMISRMLEVRPFTDADYRVARNRLEQMTAGNVAARYFEVFEKATAIRSQ